MVSKTQHDGESIRNKVLQVFKYLRQLHAIRNPVPMRLAEQPFHMMLGAVLSNPHIDSRLEHLEEQSGPSPSLEPGEILRIPRVEISEPPVPPDSIREWIVGNWSKIDEEPRTETLRLLGDTEERFDADTSRPAAFTAWLSNWRAWRDSEGDAIRAREYFEQLYRLHNELERESEQFDLLVGDGMLSWLRGGEDDIEHPILLKRVELVFNAEVPEFILQDSAEPTELYEALLGKIAGISPTLISESRQRISAIDFHPLEGPEVSAFLQQFVTKLDVSGKFEERVQASPKRIPILSRSPVLFTRKRTLGYAEAVDSMIREIENGAPVPEFLAKLVGHASIVTSDPGSDAPPDVVDVNGEAEDILLTKPANFEQLEIARRLNKAGGVVVQGPPGTGKSHTIANLVGHLLAKGDRVLITSHTAKALEVLRDQIVEPLRPLCVTILGVDAKSRAEMESSINEMTGRLGSAEAEFQSREESRLSLERSKVLERLKAARKRLLAARRDEYADITLLGQSLAPSAAAQYVSQHVEADGWIPGPVQTGAPMPLGQVELSELYELSACLSQEDLRLLNSDRPRSTELQAPSEFSALTEEYSGLSGDETTPRFWHRESSVPAYQLLEAVESLRKVVADVSTLEAWETAAVYAGMSGTGYLASWHRLVAQISESSQFAADQVALIQFKKPEIAGERPGELIPALRAMEAYVCTGKRIGPLTLLIRRDWKQTLERCSVRGTRPAISEDFAALIAVADLSERRSRLRELWAELVGADVFDIVSHPEPERSAEQFLDRINGRLSWHQSFLSAVDGLVCCGHDWAGFTGVLRPDTSKFGELHRLREGIENELLPDAIARYRVLRLSEINQDLKKLDSALKRGKKESHPSEYWGEVSKAVRSRDAASYARAFQELCRLEQLEVQFERRKQLLTRLAEVAPNWAKMIERREAPHDGGVPPGDANRAWLWIQLDQEIINRASVSIPGIQGEIEELSVRFRELTAQVAERRAWARLMKRTSPAEKSALQLYKNAVKQYGSGKGKRAARFARLAQEQMRLSQDAVPVWVMPLSRAYQTYHRAHVFDVVIIDEASQADIYALLAMAYAKNVIVVGDDEQVTPERPGQEISRVDQLIDAFLTGIPGKDLFIEESSIFDFAKVAFGTPIALTEHFRCVEPIIRFSNSLSYNNTIKPLRDSSEVIRKPATVAVRVNNGECVDQLNVEEAKVTASLVCALVEQPEYGDATLGVIAMNGARQGLLIESILRQKLEPRVIEGRRLRCGMPPQFQGDERDVMLLSLVDSPDEDGTARDPGYGPRDRTKKRYNVAASRAKDQMWVCHSLNPHVLKPRDLRRRLILHAENPDATEIRKGEAAKRAESKFEREVQAQLIDAGYYVVPQYLVGSYRIDMVVTDGERTLAVECDGDRYHTLETLEQDMSRQMILERCGYRFERIRGTEFFRNPQKAMRVVFSRLVELGIRPAQAEPVREPDGQELQRRILERAAEIREAWKSEPELGLGVRKGRQPRAGWTRRPAKSDADGDGGSRTQEDIAGNESSATARRVVLPHAEQGAETAAKPIRQDAFSQAASSSSEDGVGGRYDAGNKFGDVLGGTAAHSTNGESLVARLNRESFNVIDNRGKGGALWVVGDYTSAPFFEKLKTEGIKFIYAEDGGRTTDFKPGWFTKSEA